MDKLCRICLIKAENSKVLNLKMFEYCTGINSAETSCSTHICWQCEGSLNDFCLFKEKCIESHKSLKEMYSRNGNALLCEESSSDNLTESNTLFLIEKFEEISEEIEEKESQNETSSEHQDQHDLYSDTENISNCEDSLDNFTEPNTFLLIDKLEENENQISSKLEEQPSIIEIDSADKTKKKTKKHYKRKIGLCTYCGKSYRTTHLNTHIKNVHSGLIITDKVYNCDLCDKSYKRIEALSVHQKIVHKKIKLYVCNVCNESFSYRKRYKNHLVQAHNAPYRFACDICDYKTQERCKFIVHKRQHTGERPFQCNLCPKDFMRADLLQYHIETHSKEKNFICEVCSKAFGASRYLKAHMKTHTKERNYVCPAESCGISFIQNRVMQKHIRASHPEIEIPPPGTIVTKKNKNVLKK